MGTEEKERKEKEKEKKKRKDRKKKSRSLEKPLIDDKFVPFTCGENI